VPSISEHSTSPILAFFHGKKIVPLVKNKATMSSKKTEKARNSLLSCVIQHSHVRYHCFLKARSRDTEIEHPRCWRRAMHGGGVLGHGIWPKEVTNPKHRAEETKVHFSRDGRISASFRNNNIADQGEQDP
jgi:hypothetical protein